MAKEFECYCVQCLTLVSREAAEHIFRTGFYRITVPLCHCYACAGGEGPAAAVVQRKQPAEDGGAGMMPA